MPAPGRALASSCSAPCTATRPAARARSSGSIGEIDTGTLRARRRPADAGAGRPTRSPMPSSAAPATATSTASSRRRRRRASTRTTSPTGCARCSPTHEVLLDLHSFTLAGRAVRVPRPARQRRPARAVRAGGARGGARGAARRRRAPSTAGSPPTRPAWRGATSSPRRSPTRPLDLDPRYGIGTTEYMRSVGGSALTLECGQHDDPRRRRSPTARSSTRSRISASSTRPIRRRCRAIEALRLCEVVDKLERRRRLRQSLEQLRSDRGRRADRHSPRRHARCWRRSPATSSFRMPRREPGQEWFYLARPSSRLGC